MYLILCCRAVPVGDLSRTLQLLFLWKLYQCEKGGQHYKWDYY